MVSAAPNFITLLLAVSDQYRHHEACSDNIESCTYQQLFERAFGVANHVHQSNANRIGVRSHHRLDTYANIIGIWLAGKTYVPLEEDETDKIKRLEIDLILDEDHGLRANRLDFDLVLNDASMAYILSTSGTTGKPKDIPISYLNLSRFVDSFLNLGADLQPSDRFLQMAELRFDMSIISFLIPLCVGASFHVFNETENRALEALRVMNERKLTVCVAAPSSAKLMLPYRNEIDLSLLRHTFFGAELLTTELALEWSHWATKSSIYNLYGPSEGGIFATAHRYDGTRDTSRSVPIGKAVKHVTIHLVPSSNNLFELWIAGSQVFNGYLEEEMNVKSFAETNGKLWYKTGDLISMNERNDLIHEGRKDNQHKVMGQRIDMDGMTAAILNLELNTPFGCRLAQDAQGNMITHLSIQTDDNKLVKAMVNSLSSDLRPMRIEQVHQPFSAINLFEFLSSFKRSYVTTVLDHGGFKCIVSDSSWPNFTYDVDPTLETLHKLANEIRIGYAPNVILANGESILDFERSNWEFLPMTEWTLLWRPPKTYSHESRLRIVPVRSANELNDWVRVASTGFGQLNPDLFDVNIPEHEYYLGYHNEHIVCCGMTFHGSKSSGLYHFTTLPEYRGHGYGTELHLRKMNEFPMDRILVSQANDRSLPVWEKIGMQRCGSLYLLRLTDMQ